MQPSHIPITPHPLARLTFIFGSQSAPAAISFSTTSTCPSIAASCSGVHPACGARFLSDRPLHSPLKRVRPIPPSRPSLSHLTSGVMTQMTAKDSFSTDHGDIARRNRTLWQLIFFDPMHDSHPSSDAPLQPSNQSCPPRSRTRSGVDL